MNLYKQHSLVTKTTLMLKIYVANNRTLRKSCAVQYTTVIEQLRTKHYRQKNKITKDIIKATKTMSHDDYKLCQIKIR